MRSIPPDRTRLFGRDADTAELEALLAGGARLVTVSGPPGVGKSRLVREVARRSPRAVSFLSLDGATGIDEARARAKQTHVLDKGAAARDTLIVVDDAEGIVPCAGETVGRWLDTAPSVAFVVTSREKLHLRGEATLRLEPLGEDDAIALFADRARLVNRSFEVKEADRPIALELVRRLDRLPRGLELAAARAGMLSLAAIADLALAPLSLRSKDRDAEPRARSLADSLELSWAACNERERTALAAATPFQGGMSLEAAQAVIDEEDALDLLESLVDKSLVRTELRADRPRVFLYGCVHALAASRGSASMKTSAEERHAAFFLRAAGMRGDEELRAIERENIVAAIDRTMPGDPIAAARALLNMEACLAQKGPLSELVLRLDEALRRVRPPSLRALLLVARSRTHRRMGRLDEARTDVSAAREHANADGDLSLHRVIEAASVDTERALGRGDDPREARESRGLLDASTEVFDALSPLAGTGNLDSARLACQRTLASLRKKGNDRSAAVVLTRYAWVLLQAGDAEGALLEAEAALAIHGALGAMLFEGVSMFLCGLAETKLGRPERAAERFFDLRARSEVLESELLRGYAHRGQAILAASVGDDALALAEIESARAALEKAGDRVTLPACDALRDEILARRRESALRPKDAPSTRFDHRLAVGPTWFSLDGGERVDLLRRRALRLFLRKVAELAAACPGASASLQDLVRASWPGERILPTAAAARVWTTVRTLRDLGLRDVLVTVDGGYAVASSVYVELVAT